MSTKIVRLIPLFAVVALMLSSAPLRAHAADRILVRWFVGFGTGSAKNQIDVERAIVDQFNASQDQIQLELDVVGNTLSATSAYSVLLASGFVPDLIGPVGIADAYNFPGQWMDLRPLIEKNGTDLSQFPADLVKLYDGPQGLLGIPFAVFPSLLYYNVELFDEAGLAYPPSKVGEKYMLDGKAVDWDFVAAAEIARRLTVDAKGNDASSPDFDPKRIVQFGFTHEWDTIRFDLSTFDPATVLDASGKAQVPAAWREEARWLWNGLWKDHSIPNGTYLASDFLKPSPFSSGRTGMSRMMSWYLCCLGDMKAKWDLAVPPTVPATKLPLDSATFRIAKNAPHPEAAFTVMQYLLDHAALDLLKIYGAYPAKPGLQNAFVQNVAASYRNVKNWSVLTPGSESVYSDYGKGRLDFSELTTALYTDAGVDMDVEHAVNVLQPNLQALIEQPNATLPPPAVVK